MKIGSATSASATSAGKGARSAAGGFSLNIGGAAETAAPRGVEASSAVASLEALIALQSVEGPLERKRRAVARGGKLLDLLGEIKIGLLDGAVPASSLERLSRAINEERASVDTPELADLLDEIDTRAAVELAKLDMQTPRRDAA